MDLGQIINHTPGFRKGAGAKRLFQSAERKLFAILI
jgi:hypothetical protein